MLALNRIANVTCMRARTLHTHASRCLCSLSSTPLGATFHRTQAQATDSLCKTPGRGRKGLTSISTSSVCTACMRMPLGKQAERPPIRASVHGTRHATLSQAVASAQSVCGKESAMSKGTVLICLSGADHIRYTSADVQLPDSDTSLQPSDYCRTQDGKPKETGFFLKELGAPLIKVLEAGYDVQVLSARQPAYVSPLRTAFCCLLAPHDV